jgi:DNA-binding MarR family transcriptional regulator
MEQNGNETIFFSQELLTVEGQIIKFLSEKERMAGEIYSFVRASQSTISRKIARMVDQGMLECRISSADRRVPIYNISESYRQFLQRDEMVDPTATFSDP